MAQQASKVLNVEFMNGQGQIQKRKFSITPEQGGEVTAGALKQSLLSYFDETSPVLEQEGVADENQSYHLLGIDGAGKRTAFPDETTVDLNLYQHFQLSPRTTGGGRRRSG